MSQPDAFCWAFDIVPSKLNKLYWSNSLEDLQFKVRMKFQEEQVRAVQDYENLVLVVSQALGGKPKNSSPASDPDILRPKTKEEVQMALRSVLFPAQTV